jgi:import inner membrane translocase subunit TIM50
MNLINNINFFIFIIYGTLTLPYYEKIISDSIESVDNPPIKTLVINLNKTLVNYEYKFGKGFEILKRPGLINFLQEMGQIYEVVIFGTEDSYFVEEVVRNLDEFEMNIRYKLGKEALRLVNGHYVKDLNFLNRDLRNVICIDYNPENVLFHQENLVLLPEFNGDGKDRELIQSIFFLKEMANPNVIDIRKELEKYGNYQPYINFNKSLIKDDADLQDVGKDVPLSNP